MSFATDLLQVSQETFNVVKAATSGLDAATGLAGVNLQPLVQLVPVDTPFRNSTPRSASKMGSQNIYWQTFLNINNQQSNAAVAADYAGPEVQIANQYIYAPVADMEMDGLVTLDAIAQAQGYADALAAGTLYTLNQLMISEDKNLLNAQSFPLPAIGTVSLANHTTGGSVPASTAVYVKCAARSGNNFYYGGSGIASAEATVTSGSTTATNSFTASVAAVKGAAAYDWFVSGTTGTEVYYTTTTVNTVTITSIPTAAQPLPSALLQVGLSTTAPSAVPTVDTSYSESWVNGLLATILGDFASSAGTTNLVTPGTGISQGAYYQSLDGGQLTVTGAGIGQLDEMNAAIYNTYHISPTRYLMGSQSVQDLANAELNNPQAVTWLMPNDMVGRAKMVMGGAVALYLNKTVNGKPITLELQPHLPPGTIIAVTDEIPFPAANVQTALAVETQLDYFRFDYAANRNAGAANGGPRYEFGIRTREAFINRASPVMGVLQNVAAGVA